MNESELLFSQVLGCDRVSLYLDKDRRLKKDESKVIAAALKRRILGEPIQYILGKADFMGLSFKVTPSVLIPRPETEVLVEKAIEVVTRHMTHDTRLGILDLGTGSGCIAVSLAKFLPNAKIDALDISEDALEIARTNAKLNNVKINFKRGDLFSPCSLEPRAYNLIVSNPPYIVSSEINKLQPEVRYEPSLALNGGRDGLDFYRRIIKNAPKFLKKHGLLIMEMGFSQAEDLKNIFQNSHKFEIIEVIKDYNNIERVVVARKI